MATREHGQYGSVRTVDVTGLGYSVKVFYMDTATTVVLVDGSPFKIRRVKVRAGGPPEARELTITSGLQSRGREGGAVVVKNTGDDATATGGGIANTGYMRSARHASSGRAKPRVHIVHPEAPFRQRGRDASVMVTLYVREGTRVLY